LNLSLTSVTVRFGKVLALDDISLEFPAGTQALLWGPAGGGKTTLLKLLAALIQPTGGRLRWGDQEVASLATAARRQAQAAFGFVFQTDALFDSMSVLDNVRLPLRKRGVAEAEATERAHQALAQVGLLEAAAKRPEELSGGMKKRAGIARAIVARPQVLLADDPFAGLDPDTEAQIARLLLSVSEGRTLIAAVPDPLESLPLARQLRIVGGKIANSAELSAAHSM
jgi:phospholipid/cholesterol/gamma-HCH transport system ATP-binding protein